MAVCYLIFTLPQKELIPSIRNIAKRTRWYRKTHRFIAISLVVFMFLLGATGFMLAWKKPWGLQPPTPSLLKQEKTIAIDSLHSLARSFAKDSLRIDPSIDRIDIRYQKGVAKIRFKHHFNQLQYNIYNGKRLANQTRWADIIERVHDGSILDFLLKTENAPFKLWYASITSIGLMLLSISGFWLWYNPKRIRKRKGKF
ncbi:MAG: PepSY domain-containing protein [Flavobacteriaceae bacterium]|nr:PepSY domain-containing protein [Flavobacteriaceae bacterium]